MSVADLHCDTAHLIRAGVDLEAGSPHGHVDVPRMRAGGVSLQVFAAYVSAALPEDRALPEALSLLDSIDAAVAASDVLVGVEDAAGAERAWDSGGIAAVRAVENGHALMGDPDNLALLRGRGVRLLTLTHTEHLAWAGSSGPEGDEAPGLSPLGEHILRCMEGLGIVADVSHASPATVRDVARLGREPWVASHSCCAALCPHPRNLTDDQLRLLADAGGVVGICFHPVFLDLDFWRAEGEIVPDLYVAWQLADRLAGTAWLEATAALSRDYEARLARWAVPMSRIADHAAHAVRVAGEDAVALGSDFDGIPALPAGMGGCEGIPRLLELLSDRLPERVVDKIALSNALRPLLYSA